jgi:hypothetical protein
MERLVKHLLSLIGGLFPLTYLVLGGHPGNNNVCQMVQQSLELHLISKLRSDSALYFDYEGEQKRSGLRRRYGDRLDAKVLLQKGVSDLRRRRINGLLPMCRTSPLNKLGI